VFSVLLEFRGLRKGKSTAGGDKAAKRGDAEARGVGKAITRAHARFFRSTTTELQLLCKFDIFEVVVHFLIAIRYLIYYQF
jgi:hypothetical protein